MNFYSNLSRIFLSSAKALESSLDDLNRARMEFDPSWLINPYAFGEIVVAAKIEDQTSYPYEAPAKISRTIRQNLFRKAQQGSIVAFSPTKGEKIIDYPLPFDSFSLDDLFYYSSTEFAHEVANVLAEEEDKKLALLFLKHMHNALTGKDRPHDCGGVGLYTIEIRQKYHARPENLNPVQAPEKLQGFVALMKKIDIYPSSPI